MFTWSLDQKKHPVLILIPGNALTHRTAEKSYDAIDAYKIEESGEKVAVIALGDFFQRGEELCRAIKSELGFSPTLINPRFASGIDTALLEDLKKKHSLVITLEDGIVSGGFGEKIASFYGTSKMKVKNFGLEKKFYDRYDPAALLEELGMTTAQMVDFVRGEM